MDLLSKSVEDGCEKPSVMVTGHKKVSKNVSGLVSDKDFMEENTPASSLLNYRKGSRRECQTGSVVYKNKCRGSLAVDSKRRYIRSSSSSSRSSAGEVDKRQTHRRCNSMMKRGIAPSELTFHDVNEDKQQLSSSTTNSKGELGREKNNSKCTHNIHQEERRKETTQTDMIGEAKEGVVLQDYGRRSSKEKIVKGVRDTNLLNSSTCIMDIRGKRKGEADSLRRLQETSYCLRSGSGTPPKTGSPTSPSSLFPAVTTTFPSVGALGVLSGVSGAPEAYETSSIFEKKEKKTGQGRDRKRERTKGGRQKEENEYLATQSGATKDTETVKERSVKLSVAADTDDKMDANKSSLRAQRIPGTGLQRNISRREQLCTSGSRSRRERRSHAATTERAANTKRDIPSTSSSSGDSIPRTATSIGFSLPSTWFPMFGQASNTEARSSATSSTTSNSTTNPGWFSSNKTGERSKDAESSKDGESSRESKSSRDSRSSSRENESSRERESSRESESGRDYESSPSRKHGSDSSIESFTSKKSSSLSSVCHSSPETPVSSGSCTSLNEKLSRRRQRVDSTPFSPFLFSSSSSSFSTSSCTSPSRRSSFSSSPASSSQPSSDEERVSTHYLSLSRNTRQKKKSTSGAAVKQGTENCNNFTDKQDNDDAGKSPASKKVVWCDPCKPSSRLCPEEDVLLPGETEKLGSSITEKKADISPVSTHSVKVAASSMSERHRSIPDGTVPSHDSFLSKLLRLAGAGTAINTDDSFSSQEEEEEKRKTKTSSINQASSHDAGVSLRVLSNSQSSASAAGEKQGMKLPSFSFFEKLLSSSSTDAFDQSTNSLVDSSSSSFPATHITSTTTSTTCGIGTGDCGASTRMCGVSVAPTLPLAEKNCLYPDDGRGRREELSWRRHSLSEGKCSDIQHERTNLSATDDETRERNTCSVEKNDQNSDEGTQRRTRRTSLQDDTTTAQVAGISLDDQSDDRGGSFPISPSSHKLSFSDRNSAGQQKKKKKKGRATGKYHRQQEWKGKDKESDEDSHNSSVMSCRETRINSSFYKARLSSGRGEGEKEIEQEEEKINSQQKENFPGFHAAAGLLSGLSSSSFITIREQQPQKPTTVSPLQRVLGSFLSSSSSSSCNSSTDGEESHGASGFISANCKAATDPSVSPLYGERESDTEALLHKNETTSSSSSRLRTGKLEESNVPDEERQGKRWLDENDEEIKSSEKVLHFSFENLPVELIQHVFQFLTVEEILRVQVVSTYFYDAIRQKGQTFAYIRKLKFDGKWATLDVTERQEMLLQMQRLRHVHVSSDAFSNGSITIQEVAALLCRNTTTLRYLLLHSPDNPLNDETPVHAPFAFRPYTLCRLKVFTIVGCQALEWAHIFSNCLFPAVERFEITYFPVQSDHWSWQVLPDFTALGLSGLSRTLDAMPTLERLTLGLEIRHEDDGRGISWGIDAFEGDADFFHDWPRPIIRHEEGIGEMTEGAAVADEGPSGANENTLSSPPGTRRNQSIRREASRATSRDYSNMHAGAVGVRAGRQWMTVMDEERERQRFTGVDPVGGRARLKSWRGKISEEDFADLCAIAFVRAGTTGSLKRIVIKQRVKNDNEGSSFVTVSSFSDFVQGAAAFCYRYVSDVISGFSGRE